MTGPAAHRQAWRTAGLFGLLAAVLAVAACAGTASASLEGYTEGPGAQQLTITYVSGTGDPLEGRTVVDDSGRAVPLVTSTPAGTKD